MAVDVGFRSINCFLKTKLPKDKKDKCERVGNIYRYENLLTLRRKDQMQDQSSQIFGLLSENLDMKFTDGYGMTRRQHTLSKLVAILNYCCAGLLICPKPAGFWIIGVKVKASTGNVTRLSLLNL